MALLPLGVCRECGQRFLVVAKVSEQDDTVFAPHMDVDDSGADAVTGCTRDGPYICVDGGPGGRWAYAGAVPGGRAGR